MALERPTGIARRNQTTRARLRVGKRDRAPELMRGACVAPERPAGIARRNQTTRARLRTSASAPMVFLGAAPYGASLRGA